MKTNEEIRKIAELHFESKDKFHGLASFIEGYKIGRLEDKWISVELELPFSEEWVIVWDVHNNRAKPARYVKGEWENIYTTITHWQPLPMKY